MRLLVTGNQGFIGPTLTRMAQARGHVVTGLDIGYFEDCISRPEDDAPPDGQIVRDIRDVNAADLEGIDAVIHLAGLSNDPMGALDARLTYDINLEGTLRLARLAKAGGVSRFVFASSCSIYGAAGGSAALSETAPLEPVYPYAVYPRRVRKKVSWPWRTTPSRRFSCATPPPTVWGLAPASIWWSITWPVGLGPQGSCA